MAAFWNPFEREVEALVESVIFVSASCKMKASKDTRFSKYETLVAPFFSWKRQEFYINVFKGMDDAFDQIEKI